MSGEVVAICWGVAGVQLGESDDPTGLYLAAYDPESNDGRGEVDFTADLDEALVFPSMTDAVMLYRAVPECRPVREDGRPNRPLTAYTLEFMPLTEVRNK